MGANVSHSPETVEDAKPAFPSGQRCPGSSQYKLLLCLSQHSAGFLAQDTPSGLIDVTLFDFCTLQKVPALGRAGFPSPHRVPRLDTAGEPAADQAQSESLFCVTCLEKVQGVMLSRQPAGLSACYPQPGH